MFDESKLVIRKATLADSDFIATTIIEAEKSSTDKIGPANYFELTESEYRQCLIQMLEEDIDGCDISISSFVVAEYEGRVVAARGGWLEGDNEDGLPSAILKSNLFSYILPKENIARGRDKYEIVKDILIDREFGAYQLENSYTIPEFRGLHIMGKLDAYHINIAKEKGAHKVQGHVCASNQKSIKACENSGMKIVKYFKSVNPHVLEYYPDDTMVLMESEF